MLNIISFFVISELFLVNKELHYEWLWHCCTTVLLNKGQGEFTPRSPSQGKM